MLVLTAQTCIPCGVKNMVTVLARDLGLVHRLVRLAQQLIGIDIITLRVVGNPDAAGNLNDHAIHLYRLGDDGQQSIDQILRCTLIAQIGKYGDELVATQAGDGIALAQAILHARGKGHQQLIADVMAMYIIY